jgi:hypothetical protein
VKAKAVAFTALVAATLTVVPTYAYALCSPSAAQLAPVKRAMGEELARLAPLHPGADNRDAQWVKENLGKMVPDWLPNTRRVVSEAQPDIDEMIDSCYQPGDYTTHDPARTSFVVCVKESVLTDLAPRHVSDWIPFCGEMRDSLQNPETEQKVRSWVRDWANAYIEYAKARPAK